MQAGIQVSRQCGRIRDGSWKFFFILFKRIPPLVLFSKRKKYIEARSLESLSVEKKKNAYYLLFFITKRPVKEATTSFCVYARSSNNHQPYCTFTRQSQTINKHRTDIAHFHSKSLLFFIQFSYFGLAWLSIYFISHKTQRKQGGGHAAVLCFLEKEKQNIKKV